MVRLLVGSETSSFIYEDPGLIYMLGIIVLSISTVSLLIFICGQNDPPRDDPPEVVRPRTPGRTIPNTGEGLPSPKQYTKKELKAKNKNKKKPEPKPQKEGLGRLPAKSEAEGGDPESRWDFRQSEYEVGPTVRPMIELLEFDWAEIDIVLSGIWSSVVSEI
ncbi:hypothetical protein OROGR_010970 [Orobanche gracilis]